jgi:glutamine cyclotransferase
MIIVEGRIVFVMDSSKRKLCLTRASRCGRALLILLLISTICSLSACGRDVVNMPDPQTSRGTNTKPQGKASSAAPQPCSPASNQSIPVYTFEVVNTWPHDIKAFTQGLVFHQGFLYESTGHHGQSTLRQVELRTGKVTKQFDVSSSYFAEGMTIFQDKIYQLTWTEHKAFVYDLKSFHPAGEFTYEGEGWGLTHDGQHLIMSDGTNRLRFLDPLTFKTISTISVCDNGAELMNLNELEYLRGEIYANIWKQERIVRIDPQTGRILGWIDLMGLLPKKERGDSENVLNGIAYDEKEDRLFVTGKRWPKMFEIRLKKK